MKRGRAQKGGAILEGALTISVFLMMLIGVLDLGQFLFVHATLTERARSAARQGSVLQLTTTQVQNLVLYGTTSAQDKPPFLGLSASNVSVATAGANTNSTRLVVTLTGARLPLYSPLLPRTMTNLRIEVASPIESPN